MTENKGLFKEKTLAKLSKKVNPTLKQKKAVAEWIDHLERNELTDEVKNYFRFGSIILSSLLGYDTKNFDFESNKIEFLFKNAKLDYLVCFEAKGTKTKDLWADQGREKKTRATPVNQIIDYMMKYEIPYGVLTNYKYFVLFDRNKSYDKFHKINFLDIKNNPEKLKEFIAIFSKEYIEKGFISALEEESQKEELIFTKEFYKLYHETRLMLIKEFRDNCTFKDSLNTPIFIAQIYLNRIMFILFAEDTGKLPQRYFEDTILDILKTKSQITEHTHSASTTIRTMFSSLDKGSETPIKIYAFNGSLFKSNLPETVRFKDLRDKKYFEEEHRNSQLKKDTKLLKLDEELVSQYHNISPIIKNILIMASFDFNTEVNVNILGHIFEQSISDIEELKNKTTSRRKREGVYYTPEYITDYICRNTIIPCLSKSGTNNTKELVSEYSDNIPELEKRFNNIKILDPACGSGAFLIKAVDILLEIFREIQNFKQISGTYTKEMKESLKSQKGKKSLIRALKSMEKSGESSNWIRKNWEEQKAREIIEKNIYGVDINGESVEITKLSLFLKMATKNKKLIDLSKNIIQGNSLIDDKSFDPAAFNWKEQFKDIFEKNEGFDVVIGNPPYVGRASTISDEKKKYIKSNYETSEGKYELYQLFIEKSSRLIKPQKSYLSFITPQTWVSLVQATKLRQYILLSYKLENIIFLGKDTFDASVDTIIFSMKTGGITNKIKYYDNLSNDKTRNNKPSKIIDFLEIKSPSYIIPITQTNNSTKILNKIFANSQPLSKLGMWYDGVKVVGDAKKFAFQTTKRDTSFHPMYVGSDINRYYSKWGGLYCCRDKKQIEEHNASDIRLRDEKVFNKDKILIRKTGCQIVASIDYNSYYYEQSLFT